jgi:hypothetical protein
MRLDTFAYIACDVFQNESGATGRVLFPDVVTPTHLTFGRQLNFSLITTSKLPLANSY